jgi:signal transduction histidine kinase
MRFRTQSFSIWGLSGMDVSLALLLTAIVVFQVTLPQPIFVGGEFVAEVDGMSGGLGTYVLAIGSVLPLAFRTRWPAPVFVIVTICAALYVAVPHPRAIVIAGPLLAMYSAAVAFGTRRSWLLVLMGIGLAVAASALSVSASNVVGAAAATFSLLAATALLGGSVRSRRELRAEEIRSAHEAAQRRLEEERTLIAREVHDLVGHSLTLMTLQADAATVALGAGETASAESALAVIAGTGRSSLRDLRSVLDVLTDYDQGQSESPVSDLGSVERLVEAVRDTGLEVRYLVDGDLSAVPTVAAVSAFRIIQESLTNVVRHSSARSATVTLTACASSLELEVINDGVVNSNHYVEGRGIRGMRERVAALNGTIEVGRVGQGRFRVVAVIPFVDG